VGTAFVGERVVVGAGVWAIVEASVVGTGIEGTAVVGTGEGAGVLGCSEVVVEVKLVDELVVVGVSDVVVLV